MTKERTNTMDKGFTIVSEEFTNEIIQKKCEQYGLERTVKSMELLTYEIRDRFESHEPKNVKNLMKLFYQIHWSLLIEKLGYEKYETVKTDESVLEYYQVLYRDEDLIIISDLISIGCDMEVFDSIKKWIENISDYVEMYRNRKYELE